MKKLIGLSQRMIFLRNICPQLICGGLSQQIYGIRASIIAARQFSETIASEIRPPLKIIKGSESEIYEELYPNKEGKELIPLCTFPNNTKKKLEKSIYYKYKRDNIMYGAYKLNGACMVVRKKHFYDALKDLESIPSKGARILKVALGDARDEFLQSIGGSDQNLFIKYATVGKKIRSKRIDIKARAKMGIILRNKCQLNLVLEYRSNKDIFRKLAFGDCPHSFSLYYKSMLFQKNADFDMVQNYAHLTTAKGRYQRRVQVGRLVKQIQEDIYKKEKKIITPRVIKSKLFIQEAINFDKFVKDQETAIAQELNSKRIEYYKKNYKPI